jgi:hypothetical protein
MQARTITVDYARPRGYDVGYRAENNFTELSLPVPEELEGADSYRVYFESTVGEYLQTELLTPTDGYVTVKITSDIVPEPGNMAAQLVAFFADGEIVGYAPVITGTAKVSIPDGTERLSHSLAAEIALNTAARHSHANKAVLDKFAESKDGKPTYDGKALGGGASDFTIKMAVASGEDEYTVTSCDATVEQIDAAVAAKKRVVLIATDTASGLFWEMPIIFGSQGNSYEFGTFLEGQVIVSFVDKVGENESKWQFMLTKIAAEAVDYSNAALSYVSTVGEALDKLVPDSHSHDNKDTLDKFSDANGKLQYNGSDISITKNGVIAALGYTPKAVSAQVATGTNITLADNTEYRLTDVTTLTLTYPTGNFECWMSLTFAASDSITVTLPTDTKYLGSSPNFKNGETWEVSIKDGVVVAQKVGDGSIVPIETVEDGTEVSY